MNKNNKNIVFRRVRGRIVPIKINNEKRITPVKGAAIVATGAASYFGGKSVGSFYKKAKTMFQSSLANPVGKRTLSKTGKLLKNPRPVFQEGQDAFSFVKDPLNPAQARARTIGKFKMTLGGIGKGLLAAGSALALGELLASTQKKKADQAQARIAGQGAGFAIATYGFARSVIKPKAAARYTKMVLKGFRKIL